MMRIEHDDRIAAARFVDGEMRADERSAFAARIGAEPALAEAVAEVETGRALFAAARAEPAPPLRPGLADRVLQRARRAGGSADNRVERRVVRLARLCVLAAAAVFAVAALFASGLLRLPDRGVLQAAADAELIRTLDQQIQAAETQPHTVPR